jgi:hypothetical protein
MLIIYIGHPPVHVQATTVNMETNFFVDNHQRTRPETPPPPYEVSSLIFHYNTLCC